MSYRRAEHVLPLELLERIQEYVDGECLYIPRKEEHKRVWGEKTGIRLEMEERNRRIFMDYKAGISANQLADKYFLSLKSIQRIVCREKRKVHKEF